MATPQSSYIISHYKGFGGNFLDSQYLGAAFDTGKPHVFQSTLMKIFSSQNRFITGKPLTAITGGASNMTEIDTEIYRWTLQGADYKCARIVEVLEPSNTTPGINLTTFRIKVDLDYYMRPDVLLPEDNEYPLEIVDGPIQDGSGYIYTVRLQGDNPTIYLPVSNLEIGKELSKGWTTVTSEFEIELLMLEMA